MVLKSLYVSPRTPELRKSFIKYGFESIYGREGIDEVLEKEIDLIIPIFHKRGKTLKVKCSYSIPESLKNSTPHMPQEMALHHEYYSP